jgi:hypothetical protein
MSISDSQYSAWLSDDKAIRCILVEAQVKTGGSITTRYLSNRGYVTKPSESPANTVYEGKVVGGIKFSQSMSVDGGISMSFGDIELNNIDGSLDTWLDDYWANRSVKVFLGDVTWARADFRLVLDGVATGVDSRSRTRINIKLSDKLQRLNTPVSEAKLGGSTTNADNLIPLCFGECHNVEPLLVDASIHEYQVHNGAIENIIEVRDNGVPVSFTPLLSLGKFRLNQQPYGQITCSVQGALSGSQVLRYSETFTNASWVKANTAVETSGSVLNPDGVFATKLRESGSVTGEHSLYDAIVPASLVIGDYLVCTARLKADERTAAQFWWTSGATGISSTYANFNLLDGTVSFTCENAFTVYLGDGWYYCVAIVKVQTGTDLSSKIFGIAILNSMAGTRRQSYLGDNTSGIYVDKPQVEVGKIPSLYRQAPGSSAVSLYPNTVSDIIKLLSMQYGNLKITADDFDIPAWTAFMLANKQPVGLFLKDRANVLDVCNQLATSVGGRLVFSAKGLLSIVKLALPQSSAGTTITGSNILDRSLEIAEVVGVKAGVKIGYDRNYTVQDNLQTGIPEAHKDLFKQEWLSATATDAAAASNYNLYSEPTQEDTCLLTNADALAEAQRRLNIFSTQRKIFKYTGFYSLIEEKLGSPQTLQHSRFGLVSGKTGQIVGISYDWISPHVEFHVLV